MMRANDGTQEEREKMKKKEILDFRPKLETEAENFITETKSEVSCIVIIT